MSEQNELGGSYIINEAGEKVLVHRTGHVKPEAAVPAVEASATLAEPPAAETVAPATSGTPVEDAAGKPAATVPSIKARFAGWLTGDQSGGIDEQQSNEVEE